MTYFQYANFYMPISQDEKRIIDLEHNETRKKMLDDHRAESDELYAKKHVEKIVHWTVITLAGGTFLAVINAVTGGITDFIRKLL